MRELGCGQQPIGVGVGFLGGVVDNRCRGLFGGSVGIACMWHMWTNDELN